MKRFSIIALLIAPFATLGGSKSSLPFGVGIIDSTGGGKIDGGKTEEEVINRAAKTQTVVDRVKYYAKEIGAFAALLGGVMLTFGVARIGWEKGGQIANRGNRAGDDDTMTTAQAGARGGRQRAQ